MIAVPRRWHVFILLCLSLCLAVCVSARADTPAGQADITADTIDYDETRGEVRLLGNVRVMYDGITITSSYARYLTKKQEADFQGNVKATYEDSTITGSQLTAWFAERKVQLRGRVRLETQRALGTPQPQLTALEAESIVYDWQARRAVAQGNVAVEQAGRHAYAEKAEYDEAGRCVTMKGNVRFEQGRNEWLMSESVVIDLATKKIAAQGRVSGRFVIGSVASKKTDKAETEVLPETDLIEPAPQTQAVDDISPLLLPGLQE